MLVRRGSTCHQSHAETGHGLLGAVQIIGAILGKLLDVAELGGVSLTNDH
jgi:hypothetical protein